VNEGECDNVSTVHAVVGMGGQMLVVQEDYK